MKSCSAGSEGVSLLHIHGYEPAPGHCAIIREKSFSFFEEDLVGSISRCSAVHGYGSLFSEMIRCDSD